MAWVSNSMGISLTNHYNRMRVCVRPTRFLVEIESSLIFYRWDRRRNGCKSLGGPRVWPIGLALEEGWKSCCCLHVSCYQATPDHILRGRARATWIICERLCDWASPSQRSAASRCQFFAIYGWDRWQGSTQPGARMESCLTLVPRSGSWLEHLQKAKRTADELSCKLWWTWTQPRKPSRVSASVVCLDMATLRHSRIAKKIGPMRLATILMSWGRLFQGKPEVEGWLSFLKTYLQILHPNSSLLAYETLGRHWWIWSWMGTKCARFSTCTPFSDGCPGAGDLRWYDLGLLFSQLKDEPLQPTCFAKGTTVGRRIDFVFVNSPAVLFVKNFFYVDVNTPIPTHRPLIFTISVDLFLIKSLASPCHLRTIICLSPLSTFLILFHSLFQWNINTFSSDVDAAYGCWNMWAQHYLTLLSDHDIHSDNGKTFEFFRCF